MNDERTHELSLTENRRRADRARVGKKHSCNEMLTLVVHMGSHERDITIANYYCRSLSIYEQIKF